MIKGLYGASTAKVILPGRGVLPSRPIDIKQSRNLLLNSQLFCRKWISFAEYQTFCGKTNRWRALTMCYADKLKVMPEQATLPPPIYRLAGEVLPIGRRIMQKGAIENCAENVQQFVSWLGSTRSSCQTLACWMCLLRKIVKPNHNTLTSNMISVSCRLYSFLQLEVANRQNCLNV